MTGESCPDLFLLDNGDYAVIGTEATAAMDLRLPPGVIRSPHERIVVVSRDTLVHARRDIPDA